MCRPFAALRAGSKGRRYRCSLRAEVHRHVFLQLQPAIAGGIGHAHRRARRRTNAKPYRRVRYRQRLLLIEVNSRGLKEHRLLPVQASPWQKTWPGVQFNLHLARAGEIAGMRAVFGALGAKRVMTSTGLPVDFHIHLFEDARPTRVEGLRTRRLDLEDLPASD